MGKTVWKSCKNCGQRYPQKEGKGYFKEFCCEGCEDIWETNHPGYKEESHKAKIRKIKFKIIFVIVGIVALVIWNDKSGAGMPWIISFILYCVILAC